LQPSKILIDENISIGNPLELFREIERMYRTFFGDDKNVSEPELAATPIGGVSKFTGVAWGWVNGAETDIVILGMGALFLSIGILGIAAYFANLAILLPFGLIALLASLAFSGLGVGLLTKSVRTRRGLVICTLKGESYDAKARAIQRIRASV
jgi:hypothetical protein